MIFHIFRFITIRIKPCKNIVRLLVNDVYLLLNLQKKIVILQLMVIFRRRADPSVNPSLPFKIKIYTMFQYDFSCFLFVLKCNNYSFVDIFNNADEAYLMLHQHNLQIGMRKVSTLFWSSAFVISCLNWLYYSKI